MNLPDPKAVVHLAGRDLFIGITPSQHTVTLDTDHTRNVAPTPVELLLVALGSCTAVDVIGILQKKREDVTEYRVEVHGERRDEHPAQLFQNGSTPRGHGSKYLREVCSASN